MKKRVLVFGLMLLFLFSAIYAKKKIYGHAPEFEFVKKSINSSPDTAGIKSGDLIFQTSLSRLSTAIELATHSIYSHCGIIYKEGNQFYVFEAVQPVRRTPLADWIAHGKNGNYVIKRLKNAEQVVTPETVQKMKQISKQFEGRDYDIYFEWSDEKIYCSELIWKIYQRATGIEIGKVEKLKDFDLTSEAVKYELKVRYGNNVPMDETVISPDAIFKSDLLVTVKAN